MALRSCRFVFCMLGKLLIPRRKASSSFFEKKEPKKLFSVWLRFAATLGSLRPDCVFAARRRWNGRSDPRAPMEKSFFGSFFSKKKNCLLPTACLAFASHGTKIF
jgi:hypothetical protein